MACTERGRGARLLSGMGQDGNQYTTDGGQDRTRPPSGNRVSVYEAADALGVTVDAIRKRIQRGTIPHERHEDGRVYVLLDATSNLQDSDQDKYRTHATDALVESLSEQVEYLKDVVATRDEEIRRRDHIIAGLVERVPALEAPREPRETSQTVAEGPEGADPRPADKGAQEGAEPRPSWWRRFFGLE